MRIEHTTIKIRKSTREELDLLKLCSEESYNGVIKRLVRHYYLSKPEPWGHLDYNEERT